MINILITLHRFNVLVLICIFARVLFCTTSSERGGTAEPLDALFNSLPADFVEVLQTAWKKRSEMEGSIQHRPVFNLLPPGQLVMMTLVTRPVSIIDQYLASTVDHTLEIFDHELRVLLLQRTSSMVHLPHR